MTTTYIYHSWLLCVQEYMEYSELFQYSYPVKTGFTSKLAARIHDEGTLEDKGPS